MAKTTLKLMARMKPRPKANAIARLRGTTMATTMLTERTMPNAKVTPTAKRTPTLMARKIAILMDWRWAKPTPWRTAKTTG